MRIHLDDNRVESVSDSITNAGPSWRPQLPEAKVVELVRAGRIVLAHWESGDLASREFDALLVHLRNSCSLPMKAEVHWRRT